MNEPGVRKRSLTVAGHRTSISLEDEFWSALREIADARGLSISQLIAHIDSTRKPAQGLSSAVRIFVLDCYRRG